MKRLISIIALCLVLLVSLTSCEEILNILIENMPESSSQSSSSSDGDLNSEEPVYSSSEDLSKDDSSSESSSSVVPPWHVHAYNDKVVQPTCIDRGYTEHACGCGYTFIDTFVEPVGSHSMERGVCAECGEIDYVELINLISTETIKANITVKTTYFKTGILGSATTVGASNGSGVIIKQVGNVYYALTNNHVVYSKKLETSGATSKSYSVVDYQGNEYNATLISRLANYDLALIKFTSTESYTVLSLENGNSEQGDFVISLGQPEGQSNTITLGNTVGYSKVKLSNADSSESNVTFEVLQHDAYINSGSSGGALLDSQLNVIGINYAGATDENGNSLGSYAIPVEKVYDFFEEINFSY